MRLLVATCVLFAVIYQTAGQLPQRLSIPGAVLLTQPKQRQRAQPFPDVIPVRPRKPFPNAAPAPAPRPVVEEEYDNLDRDIPSGFDDEVAKLGISSLQSAVRQAVSEEEQDPQPVQFRPERPVPILRQDLRDIPRPIARPAPVLGGRPTPTSGARPAPISIARPAPIFRDNLVGARPAPPRQEIRDEPVRRPSPPPQPRPQPQEFRQQVRATQPLRQKATQYLDDEDDRRQPTRNRKTPVQILRKYRDDNEDGSITWGYENEDGTFKEETIGVDCITRGKYGYTDPDGVRREFNYETGGHCEDPEEELLQEDKKQLVQNQLSPKNPNKFYSRAN